MRHKTSQILVAAKNNIDTAAAFIKTLSAEEANSPHVAPFLQLTFFALTHLQSFDVNTFLSDGGLKAREVPARTVKRLFSLWTAKLVELGRLKKVEGVYDDDVYQVI